MAFKKIDDVKNKFCNLCIILISFCSNKLSHTRNKIARKNWSNTYTLGIYDVKKILNFYGKYTKCLKYNFYVWIIDNLFYRSYICSTCLQSFMTFLKTPEFMPKDNNTVLDKICFNTLNMIIPKSQYDFMTLIDLECSLTGCKITTPHG